MLSLYFSTLIWLELCYLIQKNSKNSLLYYRYLYRIVLGINSCFLYSFHHIQLFQEKGIYRYNIALYLCIFLLKVLRLDQLLLKNSCLCTVIPINSIRWLICNLLFVKVIILGLYMLLFGLSIFIEYNLGFDLGIINHIGLGGCLDILIHSLLTFSSLFGLFGQELMLFFGRLFGL